MYFVYILRSETDGSFYIGYTQNLVTRLESHNQGKTTYSRRKRPWKVVYFETFDNKTEALKREKFLKRQKNRAFYNKLIENWSGSSVG